MTTKYGLPKIDTTGLKSFIPEEYLLQLLSQKSNDRGRFNEIIAKSGECKHLELPEMAFLLNVDDPELVHEMFQAAKASKEKTYGNRIVFFAPLYIGNKCCNNCAYCGYRISNGKLERKTLTPEGIKEQVLALEAVGHKRLVLVWGEHTDYNPHVIAEQVHTVYETRLDAHGVINRVNINAAPLDIEGFKTVHEAGIGTYQIFQETYHREAYRKNHPSGPKSNYLWRLFAMDRAMEAGIEDVGIGALVGLYDYRFEALAMLCHAIHLEETFGVGPHTISFPRLKPAYGTEKADNPDYPLADEEFKKIIAVLRLAVPYTGMILTAREPAAFRKEAIHYGVSQIDAGSNIGIGGYTEAENSARRSQFVLNDDRSLDQVVGELCDDGFLPSFCTGCYRKGRVGDKFMKEAVGGHVKCYCAPNAIFSLSEYARDYASSETREKCERAIQAAINTLDDPHVNKELLVKMVSKIWNENKSDVLF